MVDHGRNRTCLAQQDYVVRKPVAVIEKGRDVNNK